MSIHDKKIQRALTSLFRYSKFKETDAPDILISCESKILEQSLSDLTPDDFYNVVVSWTKFYIDREIEEETDNSVISVVSGEPENINKLGN